MKKKKNALIILLAIILVVAFSSAALASASYVSPNPPGSGFSGLCSVTAQPSLTVRSGPGTGYSSIGSEAYGNIVNVIFVNNGWAEINIETNGIGWVSADYLSIE